MKLIGNYLSPYVRRVAISLNLLDLPFEFEELYVFKAPEIVRALNPVVRIPVLTLDDGSSLVESSAILDEIDQIVGPHRSLIPPSGPQRRKLMQIVAIAVAAMEKAQWAFYEGRVRPTEKVHAPWVEHNDAQVVSGLGYLNRLAEKCEQTDWIGGTDYISQADVTTTVAFAFADAVRPNLKLSRLYPNFARYTGRCEELEAFAKAPLPNQIS